MSAYTHKVGKGSNLPNFIVLQCSTICTPLKSGPCECGVKKGNCLAVPLSSFAGGGRSVPCGVPAIALNLRRLIGDGGKIAARFWL